VGQRGHGKSRDYISYGTGKEYLQLGTEIFIHHRLVSAVRRVDFFCNRDLDIFLRVRWCYIIFLNVHAPSEEKCGDSKASFERI